MTTTIPALTTARPTRASLVTLLSVAPLRAAEERDERSPRRRVIDSLVKDGEKHGPTSRAGFEFFIRAIKEHHRGEVLP